MFVQRITPDHIFTLLGVYGDVLKVKILFTKKDTALVQMATVQQAYVLPPFPFHLLSLHPSSISLPISFIYLLSSESVVTNLNSAVMFGKPIRINFSKHATIMTPSANPNDEVCSSALLSLSPSLLCPSLLFSSFSSSFFNIYLFEQNILYTKEYLGSPLHRFRNPSNVFKHVCPPSATLHVSFVLPSLFPSSPYPFFLFYYYYLYSVYSNISSHINSSYSLLFFFFLLTSARYLVFHRL